VFAIAVEQQQYKTYILSDQATPSRLEVVPERGGIITRWQYCGHDLLYLDTGRFANPNLSVRGGIPILFPICGNLPNDTYTYRGREYQLKQHGFARDLPWRVSDRNTQEGVSITLILESNDLTRSLYPFDFELAFTYTLKGNILEIDQRYTNRSEETMPFATGLHPYFWTADKSQLQFKIPAVQFYDQTTHRKHPFTGTFDFDRPEIDAAFTKVTGLAATVRDRQRQLQVRMLYKASYSNLVFWTIEGKEFYCLEPWSSPRNALNTGQHLIRLAPGDKWETQVRLSVDFF
jgi:galactose mutarotase-like enzyme